MDAFLPLLETSFREKKGLTFYVGGQTVVGYVTQMPPDGGTAVEVRNQSLSRIIIRLDRVDAVGLT